MKLRLFGDLETISTIADIMNISRPLPLKGFVAPNLVYFIHKEKPQRDLLYSEHIKIEHLDK